MNILVIRVDNIGDLICTTPIFQALKSRYPQAKLSVLVNTYNQEVIANNPYVDNIVVYQKTTHSFKVVAAA